MLNDCYLPGGKTHEPPFRDGGDHRDGNRGEREPLEGLTTEGGDLVRRIRPPVRAAA